MDLEPGLSLEEHFARGLYPVLHHRSQKFPEGESLEDLAARAKQAVDQLMLLYVWQAARAGEKGLHVAIVSHGLCISELIPALLVRDTSGFHPGHRYKGLLNTAWTRVTVDVPASIPIAGLPVIDQPQGAKEGEPIIFPDDRPPPLRVNVTDFNRHEHLDVVVSAVQTRR